MHSRFLGVVMVVLGVLAGCGPNDASINVEDYSEEFDSALGRELVSNGNFESALQGWTLGGTRTPISSTAEVHGGQRSLRLGATTVEFVGESWASQRISIPAQVSAARLSFYWLGSSKDVAANDWQQAQLRDESGQVLIDMLRVTDNGQRWRQRRVDLAAYAGKTVELYFNVHSTGAGTPTTLWVDDVRLTVEDSSGAVDAGTDKPDAGSPGEAGTVGRAVSVHTTLGLPDNSTATLLSPDHYLLVKPQYVVSYNSSRRIPNWVSWELNSTYLGTTNRDDSFRNDSQLPSGFSWATDSEYTGSGYDRGHQCPSEDRTFSLEDNRSTFLMTNVVPQLPTLNRGPWKGFESYLRSLAQGGWEVYVIAGPIVTDGAKTFGSGIVVPSSNFKVAVVLGKPGEGPAQVTSSTRVISVVMPNDGRPVSGIDWRQFRTSVDAIEAATGLDLLADVPRAVQALVESRTDVQ